MFACKLVQSSELTSWFPVGSIFPFNVIQILAKVIGYCSYLSALFPLLIMAMFPSCFQSVPKNLNPRSGNPCRCTCMSCLTHTMWGEQGFPLVTFKGTSDLRSLRSSCPLGFMFLLHFFLEWGEGDTSMAIHLCWEQLGVKSPNEKNQLLCGGWNGAAKEFNHI